MTEISPSIAPEPARFSKAEAKEVSEIVAHLGAALMQANESDDPIIMGHVRDAHRIALDLYHRNVVS